MKDKLNIILNKIDGDTDDLKLFILGLLVATILLLTVLKNQNFNYYEIGFIYYVFSTMFVAMRTTYIKKKNKK
jgi:hypothetical protein